MRSSSAADFAKAASASVLQCLELFVGVPQVLVLRLVTDLIAGIRTAFDHQSRIAQVLHIQLSHVLLEERDRRVVGKVLLLLEVLGLGHSRCAFPVVDHFLFIVE